MENIKIIQREPRVLNTVANVMTDNEWTEIPGEPRWFPTIIPDVSRERERIAKKGITVERVNLARLSAEEQKSVLLPTAKTYGDIFAGAPWFEEPTPTEEQAAVIQADLARPDSQFLVVRNKQGEIKGFSWSYTTTPKQLVEEKWETDEMRVKVLATFKKLDIPADSPITYFAEAGLDSEVRGLGISKIFYSERLSEARKLGYPVIVRTKAETPINSDAEDFGMAQIFGPVVDFGIRRDGKRSLSIRANTYYGGVDTEKPDRVLWALGGSR